MEFSKPTCYNSTQWQIWRSGAHMQLYKTPTVCALKNGYFFPTVVLVSAVY